MPITTPIYKAKNTKIASDKRITHSVEYFHIYTDEVIGERHTKGLEYLKAIQKTWSFEFQKVVLIDNYNPVKDSLSVEKILAFLDSQGMTPDYWAYEKSMIDNAIILLDNLTNHKLKKEYLAYVNKNNKYPCSLLTASWYLTRLGKLSSDSIINANGNSSLKYQSATHLLNILPRDYKATETRALQLIKKSSFSDVVDQIQDIFYPVDSGRAQDLF